MSLTDVEADSGGVTEAGTTQRDVVRNAVKANNRKYCWTSKITTTTGTVYNFDQEDMVKGSGCITSQCCGMSGIMTLIVMLIGGGLFGVWGMIFSLPVVTIAGYIYKT